MTEGIASVFTLYLGTVREVVVMTVAVATVAATVIAQAGDSKFMKVHLVEAVIRILVPDPARIIGEVEVR